MGGDASAEAGTDYDEVEVHMDTLFRASAGMEWFAACGESRGRTGDFEPRFERGFPHGCECAFQRFFRIEAHHGAEGAREAAEFPAQRDRFSLHVESLVRGGKAPVGVQPQGVAVVLSDFMDAGGIRTAAPPLGANALPDHVTFYVEDGGLLEAHG